jgi:predicted  nucleic acid-binding Zn-ribbon protein
MAVIVALHRPVTQQKWDRDTREYEIQGYSGNVDKILYCTKCGSVDQRGSTRGLFLLQAYKHWSRWKLRFQPPSLQRVRDAVNEGNNIREADEFDEKKAEREDSDRGSDQESVSAEVREPSRLVV